jgi:chromosome segregation ATPase
MLALKRKHDEVVTQDICKRFKTVLSTDDNIIANYILLVEKVNKLENSNTILENNITKLRKDVSVLEDKYKEQNLTLKKYVDNRDEIYKLASESKDLISKMELLTDKCKAVLAENEILKTDIKYLEKACDKSADYYRTCFS